MLKTVTRNKALHSKLLPGTKQDIQNFYRDKSVALKTVTKEQIMAL